MGVWEQGSVVLVMLSRLSENGYQLAHRYWPEEGSEQYHIFEVHLVSEHVWCDDYLVRSLYLKNSQTGETRTVTQFHFLSCGRDNPDLNSRHPRVQKESEIAATLEHIRDQRSGMVQTRSQFEFCLMAVAEETHAILKALPQWKLESLKSENQPLG